MSNKLIAQSDSIANTNPYFISTKREREKVISS